MKSNLTAITLAVSLAMTSPASARRMDDPPDVPPDAPSPQRGVRIPDSSPGYSVFDNSQTSVTIGAPVTQTVGWFTDFLTGARDLGDWFCGSCSVHAEAPASSWTSFITTVVNPSLSGPNGRWKLGDKIAVCDGSGTCVILTFHGYVTDAWFPDPRQGAVTKKDKGKYKNKTDTPSSAGAPPNDGATPFFGSNGNVLFWLLSSDPAPSTGGTLVVKVGPLVGVPADAPVPLPGINNTTDPGNFGGNGQGSFPGFDFGGGGWSGGEGGSGGGCVHVDSVLPDGRRAGDIRVGDSMMLGDEFTQELTTVLGQVSYSKEKTEEGFRITTSDGISLVCSASAPIWTDEGYVLAPHLLGKRVATRLDEEEGTKTNFKVVEQVEAVGLIQVQHITVGDRAFWAGEEKGAYILHHNLKSTGDGGTYYNGDPY